MCACSLSSQFHEEVGKPIMATTRTRRPRIDPAQCAERVGLVLSGLNDGVELCGVGVPDSVAEWRQ
jgi:hypothetical protein